MAKKRPAQHQRRQPETRPQSQEASGGATLKELLSADVLGKLKAQAEELKADEARRKEQKRQEEEEARKAEQKRLENNFEYLLNNSSMDWKKHK
ncbi:YqkE family protein [Cohnella lubricantis]|uniref:YqkE family protein n=1 Tax=Cohnella lubricantis TaxID=2163172 RepID=A0A841TCA4_9BACL|nr:YqkE family protein [Cohnella lubricantis]MBB6676627.1 YqkE family protein [Cohnella lubricantis]MBP2117362.1 transposase [Cohnella lubricantis]